MTSPAFLDQEWQALLQLLPADWQKTAQEQGAFLRKRQIQNAGDLLRLIFVYAWAGLSLRNTAAWAKHKDLATLSDVALLERFQKAEAWLGGLLGQMLTTRCAAPPLTGLPARVLLVDASVICEPGSKGTDWRLHLALDLHTQATQALQVTDATGGETFTRFAVAPGDLLVGDRGYAHRAGIAHVVQAGGQVLVRFAWQNLPLQHPDGTSFDLMQALSGMAEGQMRAFSVRTAPQSKPKGAPVSGRVIALRKPEAAAEAARRVARANARKKGHTVDARTLLCCAFVLLFTSVPQAELDAGTALALYRFRWQIECGFKRLKSGLHLDALPARDPRLCRTWLYAKLLGALLVETLSSSWASFSPWAWGGASDGLTLALVGDDLALLATGGGDRLAAVGVARPDPPRTSLVLRPAA